jgi:hypothetical protein
MDRRAFLGFQTRAFGSERVRFRFLKAALFLFIFVRAASENTFRPPPGCPPPPPKLAFHFWVSNPSFPSMPLEPAVPHLAARHRKAP